MTAESTQLNRLSRDVRRTYYVDGLFDLHLGVALILTCLMLLVGDLAPTMTYLPVLFITLLLPASKKRWAQPRVGYVNPKAGRSGGKKVALGLGVLLLLGLVMFTLAIGKADTPLMRAFTAGLVFFMERFGFFAGLVLGIVITLNGIWLGIPRFYVYGALSILAGLGSLWLQSNGLVWSPYAQDYTGAVAFWPLALAMTAIGAVLFARFLRDYPIIEEEA